MTSSERDTITPQRSIGARSAFSSCRLRPSARRRSSTLAGPAAARWSSRRRQSPYTLILHWNGTAWARVATPSPGTRFNVLNGVSAVSARNAWAVGFYRNQAAGALPLILHWNGTAWSVR